MLAALAVVALTVVVRGDGTEALVPLYLGGLATVVRVVLVPVDPGRRLAVIADAMLWMGAVHGVVALVGWASAGFFDVTTVPLGLPDGFRYPLLGTFPRATGATVTPTMLGALLAAPLLIAAARLLARRGGLGERAVLALTTAGLAVTFSKGILVVAVGVVLLVRLRAEGRGRVLLGALAGCLLVALIAATHLTLHAVGEPAFDHEFSDDLPGRTHLATWRGDQFDLTGYAKTKAAAVRIGAEHPVVGIGPGRFHIGLQRLLHPGRYDPALASFVPHSTYFGAFAESGVLGLVALGALVVAVAGRCRRLVGPDAAAVAVAFLCLGIEGISTDVMHFRFSWILLAGVAVAATSPSHPPASMRS